jgi:hypothetical protein
MMWFDIAWRTANEARQFADDDGTRGSTAPLIAMMLDRGYLAGQVISITRLLEKAPANQPKKAVISLPRIVDEMRAAREIMTRENFVCRDALPYDYEALLAAELERLSAEMAANPNKARRVSLSLSGPEGFDQARKEHELFDLLSGVAPENRARGDLIGEAFFDRLDELLARPPLPEIKALRNKSIAHAADAFSRAQAKGLRSGLTIHDLDRAHYLLFAVFQTLSVVLFGVWRASPASITARSSEASASARRGCSGAIRSSLRAATRRDASGDSEPSQICRNSSRSPDSFSPFCMAARVSERRASSPACGSMAASSDR